MSGPFLLILVPTACYGIAAGLYAMQKNWPMVFVYSGYCWANLGLLWLDKVMNK